MVSPITDPELLKELEGEQPVSDPNLLNELEGNTVQSKSVLQQVYSGMKMANPISMLQKGDELTTSFLDKAGDRVAEDIGGNPASKSIFGKANPYIAASAGLVTKMGKDIALTMAGGMAPKAAAERLPNMIERMGGRNVNEAMGLGEKAVSKLVKKVPRTMFKTNPATAAEELGVSLGKEGVLGNTPRATYDNVLTKLQEYGQKVGKAYEDLSSKGVNVDVSFEDAAKPLVDEYVKAGSSAYPSSTFTGRIKNAYDKLLQLSQNNEGKLTLDHIDEVLDDTGKQMGNLQEGSDKYKVFSKVYAYLANVRDGMVNKIAETAGDPALAQGLKDANAGYSQFMRILPDVTKKALQYGTKGFNFSEPIKEMAKMARPLIAKTAVKAGSALGNVAETVKNVTPVIAMPTKVITEEIARKYFKEAGRDKEKAKELARKAGYVWNK